MIPKDELEQIRWRQKYTRKDHAVGDRSVLLEEVDELWKLLDDIYWDDCGLSVWSDNPELAAELKRRQEENLTDD